jgi:ketosteroid isomerase-like protein
MADNQLFNEAAVKQAIAERSRIFESDFAAGDAVALVEHYFVSDSDAPVASPPGGQPLVKGRAALINMFEAQVRELKSIRLETVDISASASLAYELGRAHLQLRSGQEAKGRYVVLWCKTSAGWRAKTDFFAEGWQD